MFNLFIKFTTEMRAAVPELMQLFQSQQAALRRIEASLLVPMRISPPIVQFTTALEDMMTLPYQLCQEWPIFKELLGVIFFDKPGQRRVELGQYLIAHVRGGQVIREMAWKDSVKQDDHLSMAMILPELNPTEGYCPFPSCGASIQHIEITSGGRSCPECGRWASLGRRASLGRQKSLPIQHDNSTVSARATNGHWKVQHERTGKAADCQSEEERAKLDNEE